MTDWTRLLGYRRADGRYGIRNRVAVFGTADNVNPLVCRLKALHPEIVCIPATFGRGQLGEDLRLTIRATAGLASHPNLSGALLISYEPESVERVALAVRQNGREVECLSLLQEGGLTKTVETASAVVRRLLDCARAEAQTPMPMSALVVGLECGGSDATSGLVANPVIGRLTDELIHAGGSAIFSEPIELVGCEPMLDARAVSPHVARAIRATIRRYEQITRDAGVDLTGTNPTPDNIAGGLSTIEEKSLGALAKTGTAPVQGVLDYGAAPGGAGLWFMEAPAAAVENVTALAAGGCQLILFATGSVNPTGNPIAPTLKICASPEGCRRMSEHVDVDISDALGGRISIEEAVRRVREAVFGVLEGRDPRADVLGYLETRISRIGPSV